MGKPGLGLFMGRRKSQSNALDLEEPTTSPIAPPAVPVNDESGGFRLLSRTEVSKANERRKTQEKEKAPSKFPRFSGFGGGGAKGRNQSFEDESPGSSKRDSKSSNGTQISASRYYNNGQHGSTSTLPSSTDTSSDDNIFANVPRHHAPQPSSSSNSYFGIKKQMASVPKSSSGVSQKDAMIGERNSRNRAMTSSSYASTAIPPKLDGDLNFGTSSFDDMFDAPTTQSPEPTRESTGRSLFAEKRTFQAEPIKINPSLDVEAPMKSWDSRGSGDNLMSNANSDDDAYPPFPPPHKYSQYAPLAPESPSLQAGPTFQTPTPRVVSNTVMEKKIYYESTSQKKSTPISLSANSYQTPLTSRSTSHGSTPKPALPSSVPAYTDEKEEEEDPNMFSQVRLEPKIEKIVSPAPAPVVTVNKTAPASSGEAGRKVMTQAEFREYQKRQMSKPPPEESSDEEDYEDEEDAITKREEEEVLRRKNQQMHFAREAMRRSTTAPTGQARPDSLADTLTNGFPSEISSRADEWEDEDIPLGILAQHGFPSQTRNRHPSQPTNAIPSYLPDRPVSADPMSNRASQMHMPAFARNLPMDPHNSIIGGGLVRHANRESMGFNNFVRGPASVAGDSVGGGMGMGMNPMMYQDAGLSQPSLVDQIQMRDMSKQKYMGGASKKPQGPFTGMLGQQMNSSGQPVNPMRMSGMNGMNGMNPMNPMNPMMNMMGGQMPMMNNMGMGMGMNQMGYPMPQQNDYNMQMQQYQQMQQMMAMQQMQFQAMQQQQQQQPMQQQMPGMPMSSNGYSNNGTMGNGGFLNIPNGMPNAMTNPQGRAMSFAAPQRPFSHVMNSNTGYTPSIAPSERSNIGLSARYRPVANNSDALSSGTSMTLQPPGSRTKSPGPVKGILKKSPQTTVDEVDEDWSKMAARKNKFARNGTQNGTSSGLEDLTRGLNI
ncbi:hypothetical protein P153DRAFT_306895 [Dothidotthia symphoricarpi CBS 119687]|uniref:Uncharacterized protein n=1 Tax=Dothidotthia symphoricarpi CBS 119687 TaxID=1392245 RepID=A0A6A6APZ2_9PLEO|nr:uncharacterized protein P153DRAFT_306895 [Dothidotthia symphoricarpi CBS 119687]KAF2134062.1 hypothetical protein P153DRAFT_306895 [Dothidotthia symphoricarpi CBS 119687]